MKRLILLLVLIVLYSCSDDTANSPANGKISGKVLNALDNEPISSAVITTNPSTESILTDENGAFEFNNIPAGKYEVIASKNNYPTNSVNVSVYKDKTTSAVIVLTDTINGYYGSIEGQVIDATTQLSLANVFIKTIPSSTSTITDKDGKFKLTVLRYGEYEIKAIKNNYRMTLQTVKVLPQKIISTVIAMYDLESSNQPPEKPDLIYPTDKSKLYDSLVTFKWKCSAPDEKDKLTYSILLSTKAQPDEFIAKDITENEFTYILSKNDNKYFWKIIAKDKYNLASESDVFEFEYHGGGIHIDDLILYYNFDFQNAHDYSGNGNHGVLIRNPQFIQGKYGLCAKILGNDKFDGSGSYIELPYIDFYDYPEFTISLWVYEEKLYQIAGEAYIGWGITNNGWVGIGNYINQPENTQMNINYSAGAIASHSSKVPLLVPFKDSYKNTWVHYALVYRDGVVYGYINGQLVGSKKQVMVKPDEYGAIGKHWWINKVFKSTTSMDFRVDEVRVYKTALTESEIKILAE